MRTLPRAVLLLCLLLPLLAPAASHAQIGFYGEFSAADFNLPNTGWQYGTTFGAFYNHWRVPFFALGVDGRGTVVGSGLNKIVSGLAGPRLTFKPHILPVMPYVEALAGAGNVQDGEGVARTDETKFEYQFLGGADLTVFPLVDWRVVEFSYGGFSGPTLKPKTISTGIVIRLP